MFIHGRNKPLPEMESSHIGLILPPSLGEFIFAFSKNE